MIQVEDLTYNYGDHQVLKNLNLSVTKGEFVVVRGANGSGKSTLLKLLLKELDLQSGQVTMMGQSLPDFHNFAAIGYVPQMQVMNQMTFPVTCLELVTLNLYRDFGWIKIPDRKSRTKATQLLEELGLHAHLHRPVNELSGGLKQRTMIARALVNDPDLLILDEPMTGVDQESRQQLMDLLLELQKDHDLTILLVSHDLEIADQVIPNYQEYYLEGGRLGRA